MSTEAPRPLRWFRRWIPVTLALALGLWAIGWLILRSDWFEDQVRQALETRIERATGYSAAIGKLDLHIGRLGGEAFNVTVRDNASAEPLFTADRIFASAALRSLWSRDIVLRELAIDNPIVNFQPPAAPASAPAGAPAQFPAIVVERLALRDGALSLNGLEVPLSAAADHVEIASVYEPESEHYRLALNVGALLLAPTDDSAAPLTAAITSDWLLSPQDLRSDDLMIDVIGLKTEAAVHVVNLAAPSITGTFHTEGNAVELLERLDVPWARPRSVAIDGQITWPPADDGHAVRAAVAVRNGQVALGNGQLDDVELDAEIVASATELRTESLNIRYDSAAADGQFVLDAFDDPEGPRLLILGDLDGLHLQDALLRVGRLAETPVPADLPWESDLSGWIRIQRQPAEPVAIDLTLILEAATSAAAPLQGVIDIAYHPEDGALLLPRLELDSPAARLRGSGQINNTGQSQLLIDLTANGPDDIRRATDLAGLNAEQIFDLTGELRIAGQLSGTLPRPGAPADISFDGSLQADNFQALGDPWKFASLEGKIEPDHLTVRQFELDGALGRAAGSGSIALAAYQPQDTSAVDADVLLSGVPLEQAFVLLEQEPLAGGRANADIQLTGTLAQPRAELDFRIAEPTAYGEKFSSVTGKAAYLAGDVELRELLLRRGAGQLTVSGKLNRDGSTFQAAIQGSGWRLDDLAFLHRQERPWGGTAAFDLRGGGEWASVDDWFRRLEGEGSWQIENLSLADEPLGRFDGAMTSSNGEIHVTFDTALTVGALNGSATLSPGAQGPVKGSVRAVGIDLLKLAALARVPTAAEEASFDGQVTFSGRLGDLGELTADGTVDKLRVQLPELPGSEVRYGLRNPFPLRFRYAERTLRLNSMHIIGDGTDVFIDGTLGFGEGRPLDASVDGEFNLAVLSGFQPDLIAGGVTEVEIELGGSLDEPELNGRVLLNDASLRAADFSTGLSAITGELVFRQNRMRVESLTAKSGGGDLSVSGFARIGEEESNYRLQVEADSVRVRYPEDVSSVFDGSLTVAGSNLQSLITGEVIVQRTTLSREFQIAELIASLSQPTRTPASSPLTRNTRFNVEVSSAPDLFIDTDVARNVDVNVDLRLTGTVASPSLLGRLAFTQGTLDFQGSRFDINRGEISFVNPVRIEPLVNIELATRIRDVDVTFNLFGPVTQPNLTFRSDPPLRFDELVSLLTVGKDPTADPVLAAQQQVSSQPLFQTGASAIVSEAISQPFSKGLNRFFGVSRLKVDPQVGGAESNPSARITTEQQLTNELTLSYTYDLSSTQRQVVRVEWNPNRKLTFLVTRDANGLVGADVLYRKRLR